MLHNQTSLVGSNQLIIWIHWPSYNQSLVRRGEILFSYDFLDNWDVDFARMNENKNGKKYNTRFFYSYNWLYTNILSLTLQANRRNHKINWESIFQTIHAIHKYVEE